MARRRFVTLAMAVLLVLVFLAGAFMPVKDRGREETAPVWNLYSREV